MRSLVLLLACACGPALPAVPGRGGPAWIELESDHFTLWTDAGPSRGRELVRDMEHLRQVIYGVAFARFSGKGRSFVIALRDLDEVHVFVPGQFVAFASFPPLDDLRRPTIVLPADHSESYGNVVTHELVHVISNTAIHHQPHWFAEGLAKFFDTTRNDLGCGHVDVGVPADNMVRGLLHQPLLSASSLFACARLGCMDFRFYLTAWALYSYLINAHAAELVGFETALDTGMPEDTARDAAFTSLPRSAIDRELRAWLVLGQHVVWHYTTKLEEHSVVERPLGDADVYATRALLHWVFRDPAFAADLAASLAIDPSHRLALAVQRASARGPAIPEKSAPTITAPRSR